MADTNIAATLTIWEHQPIWLITAYFPNDLENAKATVKALGNIMNKLKSKIVVLMGDFNSTETKSSYDTRSPLPPTNAKNTNAAAIQTILDTHGFKNLWTHRDNEARELERLKLQHLTHWNHDHTRGVRIDRVYTNFAILGKIKVTTWHHPGSDHKGVLYSSCP
jgi:endonuclease/exonuclease/phosphatase family metal-dependent hydrolase